MPTRREIFRTLAASPFLLQQRTPSRKVPGEVPDPVSDLARAFIAPPDSTRPYVLWMWMGSNVSKLGITEDLEAMKEVGIGGVTIFSLADTLTPWAGVIGNSPTPEIVTFTEPWWAMVRHAATECRRLGLELILHNCAGYESSGGPWITPELAMQEIVWSERQVEGGCSTTITLARAEVDPHPHAQFPIVYIPSLGHDGILLVEARREYYRDIAVIALPSAGSPSMDKVIDLTGHTAATGELTWTPPPGQWTIYRFGHTITAAMIQPAQWDAVGMECDKMNAEAVTFHCRHVLEDTKKHVGDLIGNPGLSTLYFDSYEAGDPTWTPRMREEFRERRGYDLLPFLPILAGRTLTSESERDRFKKDFKRTVADLYRDHVWTDPWRIDISSAIYPGKNTVQIAVANGWANRLIGDEREPPDITWQMGDPVLKGGYFLKEFPEWFLNGTARPAKGRFTFTTWNYFHQVDHDLEPSGLLGPVRVMIEN